MNYSIIINGVFRLLRTQFILQRTEFVFGKTNNLFLQLFWIILFIYRPNINNCLLEQRHCVLARVYSPVPVQLFTLCARSCLSCVFESHQLY